MNHEAACAISFGITKLICYLFMHCTQRVQSLGWSESIRKKTGDADSEASEKY